MNRAAINANTLMFSIKKLKHALLHTASPSVMTEDAPPVVKAMLSLQISSVKPRINTVKNTMTLESIVSLASKAIS